MDSLHKSRTLGKQLAGQQFKPNGDKRKLLTEWVNYGILVIRLLEKENKNKTEFIKIFLQDNWSAKIAQSWNYSTYR